MELVEGLTEVVHVKHFVKIVIRTIMSYFPLNQVYRNFFSIKEEIYVSQ